MEKYLLGVGMGGDVSDKQINEAAYAIMHELTKKEKCLEVARDVLLTGFVTISSCRNRGMAEHTDVKRTHTQTYAHNTHTHTHTPAPHISCARALNVNVSSSHFFPPPPPTAYPDQGPDG